MKNRKIHGNRVWRTNYLGTNYGIVVFRAPGNDCCAPLWSVQEATVLTEQSLSSQTQKAFLSTWITVTGCFQGENKRHTQVDATSMILSQAQAQRHQEKSAV